MIYITWFFSVISVSGNQDWVQDIFAQDNRNKSVLGFLLQSKHWGQGKSESIQTYLWILMNEKYSLYNGIHVEWILLAYIIPEIDGGAT